MIKQMTADLLTVKVYETREDMGKAAAKDISKAIKEVLSKKEFCNMIFAAAPSQNDMLTCLCADESIDRTRINAYHMDEYIGLAADAPQGFANFLKKAIFDRRPDCKPLHSVNLITPSGDGEEECKRYSELLKENPPDIVCMGIGENGHIAFNDPHVADFNDKELVKIVQLDEKCRMQQVNDGCFLSLDEVPQTAVTLTIPALVNAPFLFCVVPAKTKAQAVHDTLYGEISEKCPASILRKKKSAVLYLDSDSASPKLH